MEPIDDQTKSKPELNRRSFLQRAGAGAAAAATIGAIGLPVFESEAKAEMTELLTGALTGRKRAKRSYKLRVQAASAELARPLPAHPNNGDEALYTNKIGSFSKGLKHDSNTGEVDSAAYTAFVAALESGDGAQIDALVTAGHFGTSDQSRRRRFVNPQSGLAFEMEGADSQSLAIPPAPAFASAEEAGEMVELYWMSLLRDVNFRDYDSNPTVQAACDDLSRMVDFRGPKIGGEVTPQTLFRDRYIGCTAGHHISQFLLQPAGFGAQMVDQRIRTNAADVDFNTTFADWLDLQNGLFPTASITAGDLVFCRNGRDMGQYVHVDVLFQAYFVAFLILAGGGYPLDPSNPYGPNMDGGAGLPLPVGETGSISQVGFGTFGAPGIATFVAEPSSRALKAQWFQKWFVHRRLRPEEFGGRVEVSRLGRATYPFHTDLTSSPVLDAVEAKHGSHLLPLMFPEGSPMHTSYGSGHATVAGACVTMLKAFFDESAVISNPVVPSADGQSLEPYVGDPLTVGGELNKIASNISQGRNIAGVHWRSDAVESNKLGEEVAIGILRDIRGCYNESFNGFTLTKFDGSAITI